MLPPRAEPARRGPRLIAQLRAPEDTPVEIAASVHIQWEDGPKQSLPVFVLD